MTVTPTYFWYEETDIGWLPVTGMANPRDTPRAPCRAVSTITHLSGGDCALSLQQLMEKHPCAAATRQPPALPQHETLRLGAKQIEMLAALSARGPAKVPCSAGSRSLIQRGLVVREKSGGMVCITANGLRALADAADAERINLATGEIKK